MNLNQQGAAKTKIGAITIIVLLLIGGALSILFNIADKRVSFSEEEITDATALA